MLRSDVMKSMRWGLTLSLMTDVYYQIILGGDHNTRRWYDEFDGGEGIRHRGYLGQPLGVPVSLAKGVYRRDFQNGLALNNSAPTAQTMQLGGAFKKLSGTQNPALNDGSYVTSVTIPAHDGIILLGSPAFPPAALSPPPLSPSMRPTPPTTSPVARHAVAHKPRSLRPRSQSRNRRRAHEFPHRRRKELRPFL
jgi:hypothetical protein